MIHFTQIKLLIKLGLSDFQIKSTLRAIQLRRGTAPISFRELSELNSFERSKLLSIHWKDNMYENHCEGIENVIIDFRERLHILRYEDQNGDIKIYFNDSTDLIDRIGDGTRTYGLYKRMYPKYLYEKD